MRYCTSPKEETEVNDLEALDRAINITGMAAMDPSVKPVELAKQVLEIRDLILQTGQGQDKAKEAN
jgi:hypothetical protein